MNISELYNIFKEYPSISTDSRNIKKDSLFFALKGENFNGNKFAHEAINKGCRYAVIDEKEYKIDGNFILVNNVLNTLQKLASFHRDNLKIPIIAITGTNFSVTFAIDFIPPIITNPKAIDITKPNSHPLSAK